MIDHGTGPASQFLAYANRKEVSMVIKFSLETEYIQLAKLLKATGVCSSGGMAKVAISEGKVRVDGLVDLRKGRKIRRGQKVDFEENTIEAE
jgi:ribosome-associated protein